MQLVTSDEDLLENSLHLIKTPSMVLWGKQDKVSLFVLNIDKIQIVLYKSTFEKIPNPSLKTCGQRC